MQQVSPFEVHRTAARVALRAMMSADETLTDLDPVMEPDLYRETEERRDHWWDVYVEHGALADAGVL